MSESFEELGPILSEHARIKTLSGLFFLFLLGAAAVFPLGLFVAGPFLWTGVFALLGLLTLVFVTHETYIQIRSRGDRLQLCENGVDIRYRARSHRWAWQELRMLSSVTRYTAQVVHWHTLSGNDGRSVAINAQFTDFEKALKIIEHNIIAHQLQPTFRALFDGEEIWFGPLRLSRQGIADVDHQLDWEQAKEVSVLLGSVSITARDSDAGWSLLYREIHNGQLFLLLSQIIIKTKPFGSGGPYRELDVGTYLKQLGCGRR